MENSIPPHFHKDYRIDERDLIPNSQVLSALPVSGTEGQRVVVESGGSYTFYQYLQGDWRAIGGGVSLPVAVADGGTGADNAADARTNLGLVIGTDVAAANHNHDDRYYTESEVDALLSTVSATRLETTLTAGEAISAGNAVIVATGSTADATISQTSQNQTTFGDAVGPNTGVSGTHWQGQTFQTDANAASIVSVAVMGVNGSSIGGDLNVDIYATSGGFPTGPSLGNVHTSIVSLTPRGEFTFTFATPVPVSPSTTYALVLAYGLGNGTDDAFEWNNQNSSVYANGNLIWTSDAGANWNAETGRDFYFKVNQSFFTGGQIYKADASSNDERANNFIGFAPSAISAAASGAVTVAGVATGLSGLAPGSRYYLSDTAGAIGTSAGTQSRKVGIALSSTSLLIKHDNP